MIKFIAGFVSGGIVGGAIVYFLVKEKFNQEYIKSVDAMERYYESQRNTVPAEESEDKPKAKATAKVSPEVPKVSGKDVGLYKEIVQRTRYGAAFTPDTAEEEVADEDPVVPEDVPRVYVITEEEYDKNPFNNNHHECTFYAGDGVLADDLENDMDLFNTLGPNHHEIIGELRYGFGQIFVRDERNSVEYEITAVESAYCMVNGMV